MKAEVITDIAQSYVSRLYEENEYPNDKRDIEIDVEEAFIDGANWRIESVYHDISELPNDGEMILALTASDIPIICGPNNSDFLKTLKDLGIVKWAYMKDLIPSK